MQYMTWTSLSGRQRRIQRVSYLLPRYDSMDDPTNGLMDQPMDGWTDTAPIGRLCIRCVFTLVWRTDGRTDKASYRDAFSNFPIIILAASQQCCSYIFLILHIFTHTFFTFSFTVLVSPSFSWTKLRISSNRSLLVNQAPLRHEVASLDTTNSWGDQFWDRPKSDPWLPRKIILSGFECAWFTRGFQLGVDYDRFCACWTWCRLSSTRAIVF